jgi:hypothetical protein
MDTLVYSGGADGYERAYDTITHQPVWQQTLGTVVGCGQFPTAGVGDSGTIVASVPGLSTDPVLFVAGNNPNVAQQDSTPMLYAIDAKTGAMLWQNPTQLSSNVNAFAWSSPIVFTPTGVKDPMVYIGLSSINDCPTVPGEVLQIDAVTGVLQTQNTFEVVNPNPAPGVTCSGGGVWGSPTVYAAQNVVFVATGNPSDLKQQACFPPYTFTYSQSLVALNATTMQPIASWQVPPQQGQRCTTDCDFGSTPTPFREMIDGLPTDMVGVANKNGLFYAFGSARFLTSGPLNPPSPLWSYPIAMGGQDPTTGGGSITPAAWDNSGLPNSLGALYLAGGDAPTSGPGNVYPDPPAYPQTLGSVQAFNLDTNVSSGQTASPAWEVCFNNTGNPSQSGDGHVLGAVTAIPNTAVVGEGQWRAIIDTTTSPPTVSYIADPEPGGSS